jgi:hypothetical protein
MRAVVIAALSLTLGIAHLEAVDPVPSPGFAEAMRSIDARN